MIKTRSLFVSFKSIYLNLHASHQLTSCNIIYYCNCRLYVCTLSAPLIFKAIAFVRWVVTHSLADSDFHGHWPDVFIQQHFLWYLIMSVQSGTFKTRLSVHPASHILLTKKCPQIEKHIYKYNVTGNHHILHTHLKFDNKLKEFLSQIF